MKYLRLKGPLVAGTAIAIAYDYMFRMYIDPPQAHWFKHKQNQLIVYLLFLITI